MKRTAPYFGNRFATVATKKATKARKNKATSEMEALEPRILLSGISGSAKKNVSFFDADGDKVSVTMQGSGSFTVDLGGARNNADIANITINADRNGNAGSLGVVVTPVGSFTKPVQTKPIYNPNVGIGGVGDLTLGKGTLSQSLQTQYFNLTPGYTNIGSITSSATNIGSIGLNAVVVPVIDLGDAAVGNINFSTGMVAKVDQFMAANAEKFGQVNLPLNGLNQWNPGLANIQVWDISAGSIAGINIAGIDPANYAGDANAWGNGAKAFDGNNFRGNITATDGGIGRITGTNSFFDGIITLGKDSSLGNIVLGYGFTDNSVISAEGDLTFNAANFKGLIDIGGHLHLGLAGLDTGTGFQGTIIAKDGISGLLGSSETDTILVSGLANFTGQLIATNGDIADITLNQTALAATLEGNNIGTIRFGAGATLGAATIVAEGNLEGFVMRNADLDLTNAKVFVGGELGMVDVAGGSFLGEIAANTVGEIMVRGGNMGATVFASNSIGNVTVTDGSVSGTLIAQAGTIGNITATNLDDFDTAINGATIFAATGLGNILATSVGDNGAAIGGNTQIQLQTGSLGSITALAYGAGGFGIDGLKVIAPEIVANAKTGAPSILANSAFGVGLQGTNLFLSTKGAVSDISVTGLTGGMNAGTTTINSATTVSNIEGTALTTGNGITGLTVNAQQGITDIVGTAFSGSGISGGNLLALSGNISGIVGTSSDIGSAGDGIANLTIRAVAGEITDITGTANGTGTALSNVNATALLDITTIKASSLLGSGIVNGSFTSETGNIGTVSVTSELVGISNADFVADGNITSITVVTDGAGIQNTSNIDAGGNITSIVVIAGDDGINGSNINVGGNLTTLDITAGDDGLDTADINVDGNLNIVDITAGEDGMDDNANINVGGNLTTLTINSVEDGLGDYSDIDVEGSITAINITSTEESGLDFYSDITVGGSIGSVTITADEDGIDYESSIVAEGNIGNVNITAGNAGIEADATLRSNKGSIATGVGESLTVTAARGEGIDGNVYAFNSIGDINVVVTEAEGNEAIIATITAQNGTIGNITVNSAAEDDTSRHKRR
jgi:hypothetical protein